MVLTSDRKKVPSRYTIRTSDRRVFRRCLRKWGLSSSLKGNWTKQGTEQNINFWFGSAIHFAMEDYHGWNFFKDPRNAFKAYYDAFPNAEKPNNAILMYELGIGMLSYYLDWYPKHNADLQLETLWFDENRNAVEPYSEGASPAVEHKFWLDIDLQVVVDDKTGDILFELTPMIEKQICYETPEAFVLFPMGEEPSKTRYGYLEVNDVMRKVHIVPIHYHGTIDRMVKDRYGRWWILDYKTAKGADTNKLDTDDQISAYLWAVSRIFKKEFYGFIYLQLTKDLPRPPKELKSGEYSVDKKQKTTRLIARKALIDRYGDIKKVPNKYIEWLNALAEQETPEGDRFIRWDFVRRSHAQIESTYNHILGEARMMLSPTLYLFPNPTRDCIWDCPWRDACLSWDNGDIEKVRHIVATEYTQRGRDEDGDSGEKWRNNLIWPTDDAVKILGYGKVAEEWQEDDWSTDRTVLGYTVDEGISFDGLFDLSGMEGENDE